MSTEIQVPETLLPRKRDTYVIGLWTLVVAYVAYLGVSLYFTWQDRKATTEQNGAVWDRFFEARAAKLNEESAVTTDDSEKV